MTLLSVNLNKIALLRNSRGRDFPNVLQFAARVIDLGVKGITVHPRPDERHITRQDVFDLSAFLRDQENVEFNIEGYPSPEFLELVFEANPAQCTLVPDEPGQLTSDHGWQVAEYNDLLVEVLGKIHSAGIRSSLFLDPSPKLVEEVAKVGANRIELYTEEFASAFGTQNETAIWQAYADTAVRATELGIGINAGHDLDLNNLAKFLEIPNILEVSIGHALIVECLEQGVESVIRQYLEITGI
ncbi:MAG: pyridoxine 5'-phosphate synthase [Gammaproteobacteria bacterium]|nr:pyridoxine 5'-phosphate synthase [Gammaproteobacteria bacterium]